MPVLKCALQALLSVAFTMAGLGKLVPSHPVHAEMVAKAPEWLSALRLGAWLSAEQLRVGIGSLELLAVLLVLLAPPLGAATLAIVMAGAIATHVRIDGAFSPDAYPAAFLLALALLLLAVSAAKPVPTPGREPESEPQGESAAEKKDE